MTPVPALPSPGCPCPRSGRHRYASAALIAVCAGALAVATACSTSGSGTAATKPLTPHQAISLTDQQTRRASSLSASLSVRVAGAATESTTGTLVYRLKPDFLAGVNLDVSADGNTFPVQEVLSGSALYIKLAALSARTGKPWLKVSYSDLSGNLGASLRQLFQNAENSNPQTQLTMLAAAKNAHEVGTQVLDGVDTTHYAGSVTASAALARLPARTRAVFGPALSSITGPIRFDVWIDASHQMRKVTEIETVLGQTVTTTVDVTGINQPVSIPIPPASQVASLPPAALGGA